MSLKIGCLPYEFGSSRPYSSLFLEEDGCSDDDDDDQARTGPAEHQEIPGGHQGILY